MRVIYFILAVILLCVLFSCGTSKLPLPPLSSHPTAASETLKATSVADAQSRSPEAVGAYAGQTETTSQMVTQAVKKSRHLKVAATPKPLPLPSPKEAMDTLEVETDTSAWIVGRTGIITVVIAEPDLISSALQSGEIGIGATLVPVSAYYLVALEGALPGQFDIAPAPGQQERQHRAPKGYPATWRYEVTPLRKGKVDLLFTLKVFDENATAGTDIATRPLHLDASSKFPSSFFFSLNRTITTGPGWGPVLGVVAALITALAYSTWWRSQRKSRKKHIAFKD